MPRKSKATKRIRGSAKASHHTDRPELFQQFETALKAGERLGQVCKRLQIPARTGGKWSRRIRIEIGAALRAMGLDEVSQAKKLLQLQNAKLPKWNPAEEEFQHFADAATQLAATREISRLLDHYPAPKMDQPPVPPVSLVLNVANLILPGEEPDYHNQVRTLEQNPAAEAGPQDRTAADDGATE